jgi:hypothetical protein
MLHKLMHLSHSFINLKPKFKVYISYNILLVIYTVGVLSANLPRGYPKVVDCSVGGHWNWSLMIKARIQDRFIQVLVPRVA